MITEITPPSRNQILAYGQNFPLVPPPCRMRTIADAMPIRTMRRTRTRTKTMMMETRWIPTLRKDRWDLCCRLSLGLTRTPVRPLQPLPRLFRAPRSERPLLPPTQPTAAQPTEAVPPRTDRRLRMYREWPQSSQRRDIHPHHLPQILKRLLTPEANRILAWASEQCTSKCMSSVCEITFKKSQRHWKRERKST